MARRCPSCGIQNPMGTTNCSRCGNSLVSVIDREIYSIKDVNIFSIVLLAMASIGTASFVLDTLGFHSLSGFGITAFFTNLSTTNLAANLSTQFIILEAISVAAILVEIVSIVYLRSAFSRLNKGDFAFTTPSTGTTLLIIGLILAMVGVAITLSVLAPLIGTVQQGHTNIPIGVIGIIASGGVMAAVGALLVLIGYIIGVFLGMHRLAVKFEEPLFDYAWILVLISLFFSPLGLIAAVLSFEGARITERRLNEVKAKETTVNPSV